MEGWRSRGQPQRGVTELEEDRRRGAHLRFVEQWPMKTQHSFTWAERQHRVSNNQHCAHKLRTEDCRTPDTWNTHTAWCRDLESFTGKYSAEAVKLGSCSKDGRRRRSSPVVCVAFDKAAKPVDLIKVSSTWMLTFSST